jgi:hypothetical protein
MTWEQASAVGPQYIAYRIDELGVLYFRYHHLGTVAVVLGRPHRIDNLFDHCEDWHPFTENALCKESLQQVRHAHQA